MSGSFRRRLTFPAIRGRWRAARQNKAVLRWLADSEWCIKEHIKPGKVLALCRGSERAIFKTTSSEGYDFWTQAVGKFAELHRRASLPRLLAAKRSVYAPWIVIERCEGVDLQSLWTVDHPDTGGGKAVGLDLIPGIASLVATLSEIDAHDVHERGGFADPTEAMLAQLSVWCDSLVESGRLDLTEVETALGMVRVVLSGCSDSRWTISNRDFQVRNFLRPANGPLVIIDWDEGRISPFETEHCVAYQWLLMWGNADWQAAFMRECRAVLALRPEVLRAMFVSNALLKARTFRRHPEVMARQLSYFRMFMRENSGAEICGLV